MDYAKLKQEIREIAEIAEGAPDAFKEKCFEVLLNHLISAAPKPSPPNVPAPGTDPPGRTPPASDFPVTTQLRVFMQESRISENEIKTILMVADEDVHFIREPAQGNITTGQIQWALLIALKNCILNNELSADPEDVRSICQEKGFYDGTNFASNFKRKNYARLFKGAMERQGEAQGLTAEGQDELAKVIRKLAGGQE